MVKNTILNLEGLKRIMFVLSLKKFCDHKINGLLFSRFTESFLFFKDFPIFVTAGQEEGWCEEEEGGGTFKTSTDGAERVSMVGGKEVPGTEEEDGWYQEWGGVIM